MGEVDAGRGGRLHVGGSHVRGLDRLLLPHRPRRHPRRRRLRHRELAIPPLAPSDGRRRGSAGLRAHPRAGRHDLGRDEDTVGTWGVNGAVLGPTMRARRGESVAFTVDNGLPEATTVHWHGMHLPARCDGGPHQTDRARRHLGAHVDGEPTRRDALVPPAPARLDREARLPRPRRAVPDRRRRHRLRGPAQHLRGGRHPADHPGPAPDRGRRARRVRRHRRRPARRHDRHQRHRGRVPAGDPERVRLRVLNGSSGRLYNLGLRRRPRVPPGRQRRRPAPGDRCPPTGSSSAPANASNWS